MGWLRENEKNLIQEKGNKLSQKILGPLFKRAGIRKRIIMWCANLELNNCGNFSEIVITLYYVLLRHFKEFYERCLALFPLLIFFWCWFDYHFSRSFCIECDNLQIKIAFSSVNDDRYLCSIFNVLNEKYFIRKMEQILSSYFCYFF